MKHYTTYDLAGCKKKELASRLKKYRQHYEGTIINEVSGYILCGMRTGIRAFESGDRSVPQFTRRARSADEQTMRTLFS